MAFVDSARVHLNLPERRLFARDQQEPTAAVTVSTGQRLNAEQIRVIRNIVASGAGLEPGRVALADDRGRQLAGTVDGENAGAVFMDERRGEVEAELRRNILDIVEGVVGSGAARVQVTADLNRQSVTQSSETYDPEGSVLLSRERSEDVSSDREGSGNRVSASENLPDGANGETEGASNVANRETSSETVNYALSSTTRTEVVEAGAIERLSVAVAVDGIVEVQEDGTTVWRERPQAQIEQIEALVRSAMGFSDDRGDALTVRQIEFARGDPLLGTPASSPLSLSKADIMRVAEIIVLFVTALLIIFLVARPLVKGASGVAMPQGLALAAAGADAGPTPMALPAQGERPAALPASGGNDSIDIEKIDGQVKASSLKKVANIVESHPEESIAILRSWLHEG